MINRFQIEAARTALIQMARSKQLELSINVPSVPLQKKTQRRAGKRSRRYQQLTLF